MFCDKGGSIMLLWSVCGLLAVDRAYLVDQLAECVFSFCVLLPSRRRRSFLRKLDLFVWNMYSDVKFRCLELIVVEVMNDSVVFKREIDQKYWYDLYERTVSIELIELTVGFVIELCTHV